MRSQVRQDYQLDSTHMQASLIAKLEQSLELEQQLGEQMQQASANDLQYYAQLSKEYSDLQPLTNAYRGYKKAQQERDEAEELLQDPELRSEAAAEIEQLDERLLNQEQLIKQLLIPTDPNDDKNVFLEIRAGTGGDEAALFAGDLWRMYARYCENNKWEIEVLTATLGEYGGYREIISKVKGKAVYGNLKFESGAHRVQRVPQTEASGRIHTSACTVAVLPEVDAVHKVDINKSDLKVDTYRASGAGGQHVNKTDSAVRITHMPSGIVVECQDERSQHKNRARAMALLEAKLLDNERRAQQQQRADTRKSLVGSGDRSERIRTYNYPQSRVTEHRVNLSLYSLPAIMEGDLDTIIKALLNEHKAEQMLAFDKESGV